MAIESINPANGQRLGGFAPLGPSAIEDRLTQAWSAFALWKRKPFPERAQRLEVAASLLEARAEQLGRLATLEMGKPLRAAVDEVLKSARGCRYYAQHAEHFLSSETIPTEASQSFIRYEPLGPVLAIMPWNFPFWQVFRFAAPAIMAGNVVLLKHAPNVPQCAFGIEDIFLQAGFPLGVFQNLPIETTQVPSILDDERIRAVTLTGSDRAGREVAARAGRALKKTVLELGGSDPFIVMPSANLDHAVSVGVKSRTGNTGQSCIAAKRFIVAREIADDFLTRFVRAMESVRIGDPADPTTEMGPMARPDLLASLDAQVKATVAAGASVLTGGAPLPGPGCYYPATILTNIPLDSPAYREEMFGPVASVFVVDGIDEAIRVANDTPFGLGASVWTSDGEEQNRFINELESGQVFINAMVVSDPRLPFGGVKTSGYGRELGIQGIREFVQIKTVWAA
jgi:succinate-semialdehyde dehydrogenase/glutarate-semialdehyde dehydrogenase